MTWQSLDTCPNDGQPIWVFGGQHSKPEIAKADGGWWRVQRGILTGIPTHWCPLKIPAPPEVV